MLDYGTFLVLRSVQNLLKIGGSIGIACTESEWPASFLHIETSLLLLSFSFKNSYYNSSLAAVWVPE